VLFSPNFHATSAPDARPFAGDFLQEWISGQMLRRGDSARFYNHEYAQEWEHRTDLVGLEWQREQYFPMVYPPFYYLLVLPLSYLPFTTAALVWLSLMALAFLASWHIFTALVQHAWGVNVPKWWLPASLLFMPLIENFTSCQKGTVLLLLLTAVYALLVRGRSFWAGVTFGLIAFKPQYALPIAVLMLLKQDWKFIIGGLVTGSLLVGICGAMGYDLCQQYWEFSRHAADYMQSGGYDLTKSHSWYGFLTLLSGETRSAFWVRACTLLILVTMFMTVAAAWRVELSYRSRRFAYAYSAAILATILASPHVYTYDLTMLLLPMALVGLPRSETQSSAEEVGLAKGALLLFCTLGLSPSIARVTGIQLSVPALFGWLCLLSYATHPVAWKGLVIALRTRQSLQHS
jgi:hypothetical protein